MNGYAEKGFFGALFDISFSEFITTKVIKVLYCLGMLLAFLGVLSWIVTGFGVNAWIGVIALILSPLIYILSVIWLRICLELIIVVFRISDNVAALAKKEGAIPAAPTGPATP